MSDDSRFATVSYDAINEMIENNKNKNMQKNTSWALGVFNKWRQE